MTENGEKQMTLAPEKPLQTEAVQLAVADLVGKKKGRLIGPPPSDDFILSVQQFGILQPILVVESGKTLKIRDGRRRLRAAAELGIDWVPAYVLKSTGWDHDYVLSAIANEQRSDNAVATLEVLVQLRKEGVGERETLEGTGIPIARQRRLLKLTALNATLLQGLSDGAISLDIAEDCGKLTPTQQEELARIFKANHALTASDVRQVRGVREREGENDEGDIEDVSLDWREKAVRSLREAQAVMPVSAAQIRRSIDSTIAAIRSFEEPDEPQGAPVTDPDRLPERSHRQVQREVQTRVGASLEEDEMGDVEEV